MGSAMQVVTQLQARIGADIRGISNLASSIMQFNIKHISAWHAFDHMGFTFAAGECSFSEESDPTEGFKPPLRRPGSIRERKSLKRV